MFRQWLPNAVVGVIILIVSEALSAGKPLPGHAGAYTKKNLQDAALAFAQRFYAEQYAKHGKRDERWNEFIEPLFEDAIIRASGVLINPERRIEFGRKAIDGGCDDPLVLFAYARALGDAKRWAESTPYFEQALPKAAERGYSAFTTYRIQRNLLQAYQSTANSQQAKEAFAQLPDAILASMDDGFVGRKEARPFLRMIMEDIPQLNVDEQRRLAEQCLALKNADPWLVGVIAGKYHVDEAWRQRGGGWAKNVTRKGQLGFIEHLDEARRLLTEAYKIERNFPEAPARMIPIAMANPVDKESPRDWFDRAVAAQFDWMEAYNLYINSIRPRWSGSYQEMYAFALECSQTNRFDTDVPIIYAQVLHQIYSDMGGSYEFYARPEVFAEYQRVLKARQKELDGTIDQNAMVQFWMSYVCAAYKTGRYVEAKETLDRLGEHADPEYMRFMGVAPDSVRATVAAFTGPFKDQMKAAEKKLTGAGDLDAAIAIFEKIVTENEDATAAPIYQGRLDTLKAQRELIAGKTIDLPADSLLAGWDIECGEFSKNEDGVILAKSTTRGAVAFSRLIAGPRFELEAEVDPSPEEKPRWQCAALYLGEGEGEQKKYHSLDWQPLENLAVFMHTFDPCLYQIRRAPSKLPNRLRLQMWDGRANLYIGDQLIFAERPAERISPESPVIGIGCLTRFANVVTPFRSTKLRILNEKPESEELRFHRLLDDAFTAADKNELKTAVQMLADAEVFKDKNHAFRVGFTKRSIENRQRVTADVPINVLAFAPDPKDWGGTPKFWKVEDGKMIGTTKNGTIFRDLALDLPNYQLSFRVDWNGDSPAMPTIQVGCGMRPGRHFVDVLQFAQSGLFFKPTAPNDRPHQKFEPKSESPMDITVRKQGRRYELFKNGERITEGQFSYYNMAHGYFSFVVFSKAAGDTVTFSNIQITPLADE